MRKILILFVCCSYLSFSQTGNNYEIYLILDNEGKNSYVKNIVNDTIAMKIFLMTKSIPRDKPKYELIISNNGEIERQTIADLSWNNPYSLSLYYLSTDNTKHTIFKKELINVLTDEDLKNAKFSNFLKVLREAKKVYAIDRKDKENSETEYMAYEVSVKSMFSSD